MIPLLFRCDTRPRFYFSSCFTRPIPAPPSVPSFSEIKKHSLTKKPCRQRPTNLKSPSALRIGEDEKVMSTRPELAPMRALKASSLPEGGYSVCDTRVHTTWHARASYPCFCRKVCCRCCLYSLPALYVFIRRREWTKRRARIQPVG